MIIYHGSTVKVETPEIMQSERMLDFGAGFYTTTNKDQAIRWAQKVCVRRKSNEQYISIYEFNLSLAEKDLIILHFDKPDANWLDFVCANRSGRDLSEQYDIVFGPVADDNVYATVQLYEIGVLDLDETLKRLKIEELFNQVLFHTDKSLEFCKYKKSIKIGDNDNG